MTERFTNEYHEFSEQIKNELLSPASIETPNYVAALYLQFSQLPVDRFSIHYLKGNLNRLLLKKWNSDFDNKRFELGVYNLDRIAINESTIDLTEIQAEKIDKLVKGKHSIENFNGIILDGYDFLLKTRIGEVEEIFEWKVESQLPEVTKELVSLLTMFAGI